MSADEFFETLTGLEETAIASHFGSEITDLAQHRPLAFIRALVFIDYVRNSDGRKHRDLFNDVQALTIREVQAYFPAGEDEPMPEEPVTAEGEGVALVS